MTTEIMEKRAERVAKEQKEREPKKLQKRARPKGERKIRQYRRNRLLLRQHPLPHPSIVPKTIIVTKNTNQSSVVSDRDRRGIPASNTTRFST
jgi:hypothetical protein